MLDIAVQFDPTTFTAAPVFNGRDFALDDTPLSAMLLSVGTDRRAHTDDTLPDAYSATNPNKPGTLMVRRGWPGDALDPQGRLSGGRLWVFQREKSTETTRKAYEDVLVEAVSWLSSQRGYAIQIAVRWVTNLGKMSAVPTQILGFRIQAGNTTLSLQQALT